MVSRDLPPEWRVICQFLGLCLKDGEEKSNWGGWGEMTALGIGNNYKIIILCEK